MGHILRVNTVVEEDQREVLLVIYASDLSNALCPTHHTLLIDGHILLEFDVCCSDMLTQHLHDLKIDIINCHL